MLKNYIVFSFLLVPFFAAGQNNGCIDSVSFNRYYNQYFAGLSTKPAQRDASDNFYLNAGTVIGGNRYQSIIKFNSNNQLIWYKNYIDRQFFTEISPGEIIAIDNSANLFFTNYGQQSISLKYISRLSKFDSSGNFIWGRRFERTDAPSVFGGIENDPGSNTATDGSTFYFYSTGDDLARANIVKIDAVGNISWSKKYGNIGLPQFRILKSKIAYQKADVVVLFSHFYYDAASPASINAKHGIQMVKINTSDGSIISQKTLMYYNDANGTQRNQIDIQKLKYDKSKKQFLLDSRGEFMFPINKSHVISLFDENLNHLKSNYFVSANFLTGTEDVRISEDNKLTITNRITSGAGPTTITYAAFDNNIELTAQRKIVLNAIGFFNGPFISNVTFKQNGILNFQLGQDANSFNPGSPAVPIFLFDHSPFYQGISNCLGYDTAVYTKNNIYALPVNGITFSEFNGVPLQSTNVFYTDPILDLQMVKTELCKEISICDTIKLFGTQYHCLSSPLDSFKIIRNPLCKRITNWHADTNYIKILNQNDTAFYVQYLQPYRGKIKVSFGGCSLTDSIAIEVYAAQTGVNLGSDTMHCPGKTITLRAGKKFKTYQWQDGSSKDSLVAAQPGQYHVTATDSCGNVFKDTVDIKPMDVTLNLTFPGPLCSQDTTTLSLPNTLYNYTWLPAATATLNGYNWRLYPSVSTVYSITGERYPGCQLKDTILIKVKQCNTWLLFPNSFTPDDNGINDLFKPALKGLLQSYKIVIYNRYGQPVFTTTDAAKGWDGRYKNSSKPQAGAYVWSCQYQFEGWPMQQEQGTFILIR